MTTARSMVLAAGLLVGLVTQFAEAQTYRSTRPIRGAWLRPPSSVTGSASLETQLQGMAQAGLTDLYLETLYWGVSTGKKGVFNNRFTQVVSGQVVPYDYLAAAIPVAAKYNIRLHAWCETAYLQFGSTGAYNFTINAPGQSQGDPAWMAINISTGAGGGDGTSGQVFGNLCHPGLQAKLRSYFGELAGYPGLWGVQSDYHRFALDNNTGDSYPSPWSYDTWSRTTFQGIYGSDPQLTARFPGDPQYNNWLAWRKAQIAQAANQMKQGIDAVNTGIDFSIAMFANPEVAKCQDWQSMAANGYVETLIPMAYGSTQTSITNDLNTVRNNASGRRVVAGLYTDSTSGHPTISQQLAAATSATIQEWVFFSAGTFQTPANQTAVRNYVTATVTKQRGDFNNDGYVDARDWALYDAVYTGTPVNVTGPNSRYNYNGDSVINATDYALFKAEFARFRFGEDGVVDQRDLDAFLKCVGATTPVGYPSQHLYDLNGDGVVNYTDQLRLHSLLTATVTPDSDVNADGKIDIDDLYALNQNLNRDVNRDGLINTADIAELEWQVQLTHR